MNSYEKALRKIEQDKECKPFCVCIGPTGPTGPAGGPTGPTGPTATCYYFFYNNVNL